MAGIYVSRCCAVVSRTSLVFSFWTGQGGTWVLVAINGFLTGLTWIAGNGSLLWLVDCALELSSGFPLDRTNNQNASSSLRGLDQRLWSLRRHGSPDKAPKLVWLAGQIDGRSSVVFQFSWFGPSVLKPILKGIKTNKQALAKRLLHYNFKTSHSFHCEHALTKRVCQFDAAVYDEANFECPLAGIFTFIWRFTV